MVFWCSTDKGVDVIMKVKNESQVFEGHGRSDVLSRNLTTTQDLIVTCTSNRAEEKTSHTITLQCAGKVTVDETSKFSPSESRNLGGCCNSLALRP